VDYTQGSRLITYERRAGTHMSESEGVPPVEGSGLKGGSRERERERVCVRERESQRERARERERMITCPKVKACPPSSFQQSMPIDPARHLCL